MYQFTSNGEVIGYAVEPNYIKKLDNGCYGLCNEEEATGVSVNGTPYRLDGKELDGLPIAEISEIPDGNLSNEVLDMKEALSILGVT